MTARRFALLLVLYVSLDFANPLMPGAVWFLDGSVDMVHADRVRPESVPIDAALADLPAHGQPDVLLQAPRLSRPVIHDRRQHRVSIRRLPHAPPDSSPSSEDH